MRVAPGSSRSAGAPDSIALRTGGVASVTVAIKSLPNSFLTRVGGVAAATGVIAGSHVDLSSQGLYVAPGHDGRGGSLHDRAATFADVTHRSAAFAQIGEHIANATGPVAGSQSERANR
jgi:hypothetical protein